MNQTQDTTQAADELRAVEAEIAALEREAATDTGNRHNAILRADLDALAKLNARAELRSHRMDAAKAKRERAERAFHAATGAELRAQLQQARDRRRDLIATADRLEAEAREARKWADLSRYDVEEAENRCRAHGIRA